MKLLKQINKKERIVQEDDGFIKVEWKHSSGEWKYLFGTQDKIQDYINELLEKIDDLENELIEYGEYNIPA